MSLRQLTRQLKLRKHILCDCLEHNDEYETLTLALSSTELCVEFYDGSIALTLIVLPKKYLLPVNASRLTRIDPTCWAAAIGFGHLPRE